MSTNLLSYMISHQTGGTTQCLPGCTACAAKQREIDECGCPHCQGGHRKTEAGVEEICGHKHTAGTWDHKKQAYENTRCTDCGQKITLEEFLMICTRCGVNILKGEKYYRTKRGPHHETCPQVSVAYNHETGLKEVRRCNHGEAEKRAK